MNVCWIVGLLASCLHAGAEDMGIQFNETLKGYISQGNVSYQKGYDDGKAVNRTAWFHCDFLIPRMRQFVGNSSSHHVAQCVGRVFVQGFTDTDGSKIVDGTVEVFDKGVVNHELQMQYHLPFNGAKNRLEGVKYIIGDDCTHLLEMSTTLYTHILGGSHADSILASGILIIDTIGVVDLLQSIELVGNGTDADKVDVLVEFAKFLLSAVEEDCLNLTNWETRFWYIWASDGNQGFLLDLIERPDKCEIRLETYQYNTTPQVQKQWLNLADLNVSPDHVAMGSVVLSYSSVSGSVNNVSLALSYNVTNGSNHFVPPIVSDASLGLIPDIYSRYGDVTGGQVNHHSYMNTTPLTFTTYTFKVGLSEAQWAMISAMRFKDKTTNKTVPLKVEVVSLLYGTDHAVATSYIQYEGIEHHLNDPLTSQTRMTATGEVNRDVRQFGANIKSHNLQMTIDCHAPVSLFALLDHEGKTVIHTTVLGDCVVNDKFICTRCALLEVKSHSDN